MHQTDSDLPALISSRICHDLAGPLMAIANGLELLEMSGLGALPEATLLSDSVKAARARMEFFRIAYGSASATAALSSAKCANVIKDNFGERKISVQWLVAGDLPRSEAKLAFLLAQCCESAIAGRGSLDIERTSAGWQLRATAERMNDIGPLWTVLSDGTGQVSSAEVHFSLAAATAKAQGLRMTVDRNDGMLTLTASA